MTISPPFSLATEIRLKIYKSLSQGALVSVSALQCFEFRQCEKICGRHQIFLTSRPCYDERQVLLYAPSTWGLNPFKEDRANRLKCIEKHPYSFRHVQSPVPRSCVKGLPQQRACCRSQSVLKPQEACCSDIWVLEWN